MNTDKIQGDKGSMSSESNQVEINQLTAQCLNYLKATNLKLCLLVNFGRPRVEIKRLVL